MNRFNCKKIFDLTVFISVILIVLGGCKSPGGRILQREIDSISAKWVPDQREGICSIEAKITDQGRVLLTGETTSRSARNEITKTLNDRVKTLVDSILIIPDTISNNKYRGLVTLSVANLRKKPDHRSELVSQAIMGTPVLILKSQNNWLLIQTPDNYISWTEKSSLELMTQAEMNAWKRADRVIYRKNTGWINDNSADHSGVIGDIVAGSILKKTEVINAYTSVILPDGRTGLIENRDLVDFNTWKSTVRCTSEGVGTAALSLLGVPYLWGGSSPKGVDCSGFVRTVYFMNGVILSRDASLQALHGNTIAMSDGFRLLEKGDLLFFGSKENGSPHVTHVGIYLGHSEYINSSGRVMINSLDSTQAGFNRLRLNSLLSVKRIAGVNKDDGIVPVAGHPWY